MIWFFTAFFQETVSRFWHDTRGDEEKMRLRRLRLLAVLLIFAMLSCKLCVVNVNAAQGVAAESNVTELSGFRITDLSRPVAGKDLDFKARVRTDQNVTWEIPVIWTDDLGNTAYTAEPGRTYIPHFAFFIPDGYTIKTDGSNTGLSVKLPDFVTALLGGELPVYIIDAEKGITYITFISSVKKAVTQPYADEAKMPAVYPGYDVGGSASSQETRTDSDRSESDSSSSGGISGDTQPQIPEQVRIHCSEEAIEVIGPEALEYLVTLVKNKLEPQAVNLLRNSFDAYKNAPESALGKEIGLYVYYETGTLDDGSDDPSPTPVDALAYVSGGYLSDVSGDQIFKYVIGIDTKTYMEKDTVTGNWILKQSERDNLDNTIVHEMMHAFMDDYTRRGSFSSNDSFPTWFTEGIASAVENVYQYRSYLFQTLANVDPDDFNRDLKRYEDAVSYSNTSVLNKYTDEGLSGDYRYDLSYSTDERNNGSAYVSGYLAVVYLGYLAAMSSGHTDVVRFPEQGSSDPVTVNVDEIRYGASRILEQLHEGYSLDSIIKRISATGAEDANPYYTGTDDFAAKFIKGSGEDNVNRVVYGTNVSALGSLSFCQYYLNYLESQSKEGDNTRLANGSILSSQQNYNSPLSRTAADVNSDLYKIIDSSKYVASTVGDEEAWDHTGGKSLDHLEDDENGSNEGNEDDSLKITQIYGTDTTVPIAARGADQNVTENEDAVQDVWNDQSPETDGFIETAADQGTQAAADIPEQAAMNEDAAGMTEPQEVAEAQTPVSKSVMSAAEPVLPTSGIEEIMINTDSQVAAEGDENNVIIHDEDAILPENESDITECVTSSDEGDDDPATEPDPEPQSESETCVDDGE